VLIARTDRARAEAVDARERCDATALEAERLTERLDDRTRLARVEAQRGGLVERQEVLDNSVAVTM
jgi:hypothetical protein